MRNRRSGALATTTTALVLTAGATVAGLIPTASAAPPVRSPGHPASVPISQRHPARDWLGSQIAKHEGAHGHASPAATTDVTQTPGLDVSGYQGNVDWGAVAANGAKFAYVKATEGTYYTNGYFDQQYTGSYNAGLIHGAYHFATPDTTSGATQADYFVDHGGGWSGDGKTLPGLLDMEYNPYGSTCYGLSQSSMASWVQSFSDEYHARTGRYPVIYTSASWWSQCVGTAGDFSSTSPLMVACYCSSPGTMPYNWGYQTIWQYADSGTFPGDQDYFNGDTSRLQALANG